MRIITYIYHKHQPNVGKYTIHGWYGFVGSCWKVVALRSKEVLVRLERLESQQLQTATANAERREEIRLWKSSDLWSQWVFLPTGKGFMYFN